jgi:hypothetical protein
VEDLVGPVLEEMVVQAVVAVVAVEAFLQG